MKCCVYNSVHFIYQKKKPKNPPPTWEATGERQGQRVDLCKSHPVKIEWAAITPLTTWAVFPFMLRPHLLFPAVLTGCTDIYAELIVPIKHVTSRIILTRRPSEEVQCLTRCARGKFMKMCPSVTLNHHGKRWCTDTVLMTCYSK